MARIDYNFYAQIEPRLADYRRESPNVEQLGFKNIRQYMILPDSNLLVLETLDKINSNFEN